MRRHLLFIVCVTISIFLPGNEIQGQEFSEAAEKLRSNFAKATAAEEERKRRLAAFKHKKRMNNFVQDCARSHREIQTESDRMFGSTRTWQIDSYEIKGGLAKVSGGIALKTNNGFFPGVTIGELDSASKFHVKLFKQWNKFGARKKAIWMAANSHIIGNEEYADGKNVANISKMDYLSNYKSTLNIDTENDALFLFQLASASYFKNRSRFVASNDYNRLANLAREGDTSIRKLASLLQLRELLSQKSNNKKQNFGNRTQKEFLEIALQNLVREGEIIFTDRDPSFGEDLLNFVNGFNQVLATNMEEQIELAKLAVQLWKTNKLIAQELLAVFKQYNNDQDLETEDFDNSFELEPGVLVHDEIKNQFGFFVTYKMTNLTDKVIPASFLIINANSEFSFSEEFEQGIYVQQSLLELASLGDGARLTERNEAMEEFLNCDKTYLYFVEDWQPGEELILGTSFSTDHFFSTNVGLKCDVVLPKGWKRHAQELDPELLSDQLQSVAGKPLGRVDR